MILGLTGGIGSGKSTVSKILNSVGIKVFDADLIAKDILELKEVKEEIKEKLGNKFIIGNKTNKKLLKKEIFSDDEKLKILNGIIHPKVKRYYESLSEKFLKKKEIVVFDIPLLFEVGLESLCNKVIVVDIDSKIQIERVKKRDSLSSEFIEKILEKQMPREEKLKKADIIIENNGSLEELENKVFALIERIREEKYEDCSPSGKY
ncbi:dephospho-CoA kinase [uncultured Cetobacterium sp.]|uniref:dephospho-CoA kinase n=1 Tax=uncultured Cetobacterium sp. TaxID=527638 RepID=UPI0026385FC2|nr:dephospho-CoA kinase [uncultured Cetobacterium sp.]